jgi:restriction endonuclease EcoRII-like protein
MPSPNCERATAEAFEHGKALLKFISPNDAGLTGGHQSGYYLPKPAWQVFTRIPPEPGKNTDEKVKILWQDGRVTESRIVWYGAAKREYRLTRFGKDFPYLNDDTVGNLLVLIPRTPEELNAYVLDLDDDIEEIQASLGVEVTESWAAYARDRKPESVIETVDGCFDRRFREFVAKVEDFPTGAVFSEETVRTLLACIKDFDRLSPDEQLVRCMEIEYRLFKLVELKICGPEICRLYKDVDDFLKTALSILNRRKSRAGRSLENHVGRILGKALVPFDARPEEIRGEPDFVIPGRKTPGDQLIVVGVKNTCKDRWRQVLDEAAEAKTRYILTMQQGISIKQLRQMNKAGLRLVVPEKLHAMYPPRRDVKILTVVEFISELRNALGLTA